MVDKHHPSNFIKPKPTPVIKPIITPIIIPIIPVPSGVIPSSGI